MPKLREVPVSNVALRASAKIQGKYRRELRDLEENYLRERAVLLAKIENSAAAYGTAPGTPDAID